MKYWHLVAQWDRGCNAMVVSSIEIRGNEIFNTYFFSNNQAQRGVEFFIERFSNATPNASGMRWKMGNGNVQMENGVS